MEGRPALIFFDLFHRLRTEAGIELDFQQYQQFLFAFSQGLWKKEGLSLDEYKSELHFLCKTLWLSNEKYKDLFEQFFNDSFQQLEKYWTIQKREELLTREETSDRESETPSYSSMNPSTSSDQSSSQDNLKESPTTTSPPIDKTAEVESKEKEIKKQEEEKTSELFLTFGQGTRKVKAKSNEEESILNTPFLFSYEKHLPVAPRRAVNILQQLKNYADREETNTIDVKQTARSIAKEGFFLKPRYAMKKVLKNHIFLLNDHRGLMEPFKNWSKYLYHIFRYSHGNNHVERHYYQDHPSFTQSTGGDLIFSLFSDEFHTTSVPTNELKIKKGYASFLIIFSHAGALNHQTDPNYIKWNLDFLSKVKTQFTKVIWINPLPNERWTGTSAEFISFGVEMVTFDEIGLKKAVNLLHK